jgi:hypothetical protein
MRKKPILLFFVLFYAVLLWGDEGFGDIFGETPAVIENQSSGFTASISGVIGMEMDYFMDNKLDSEVSANPYGDFVFNAGTDDIEATAVLSFSASDLESSLILDDIIDELYLNAFFSFGYIEMGHVIDPLNPLDQTNGVYLNLNDMKSSEIMVQFNFYMGETGLLELVYKPFYTSIAVATEGRWSVFDISALPGAQDIVIPETHKLAYSQAAARATFSAGPFDLGLMYYYGFMTEPGYKFTSTLTGPDPFDPADYTTTTDIVYTGAHLFGAEAAVAIGPFTVRTEVGYWLTEDLSGDNPELYNNRFVYLGGIDLTIPGTALFLSAQIKGAYVFLYDNVTDEDVDKMASYNNTALSNTIMATAEWPFLRDTMKLRVSALYQIESMGYMVVPVYFWNIKDDLEFSLYAKIFGGKASTGNNPYYSWDKNDSVSISLKYFF